jgi:hypothetical protein
MSEPSDKTKLFIQKAQIKHGDKYDYSNAEYTKAINKLIIKCKKHGDFSQQANLHLMGSGCVKCYRENNSLLQRSNTEIFIQKAQIKHGDKYDYTKVVYIKSNEKVIIICKEHGEFLQTPNKHLQGGCILCGFNQLAKTKSKSNEDFINEAKIKHGDKYDYSNVNYKNSTKKVIITCKEHGNFLQTAGSHLQGHGCKECSIIITADKQRKSHNDFINEAKAIHGDQYDYSKMVYGNNGREPVIIICNIHGEFLQAPKDHLQGHGCKLCGIIKQHNEIKLSNKQFIEKGILIHEDKYDYSNVVYGNNGREPVVIICKIHGEYLQKPQDHLSGCGCPKCANRKYSRISISYLDFMSTLYNIYIQHGENSNEFKIPNSTFKADGYCPETNTIYEFHGTIYHGDPRVCNPEEYNYFGKNYGELYQKTLEREQQIKNMGYNLVVMWEYDWNNINKSIKILQRRIKKYTKLD